MKKYDINCDLSWSMVALFFIGAALKMGLGDLGSPRPGFFPFLVGILLLILSLGIIFLAVRETYKDRNFRE